jgi:hypothetical protein
MSVAPLVFSQVKFSKKELTSQNLEMFWRSNILSAAVFSVEFMLRPSKVKCLCKNRMITKGVENFAILNQLGM